MSLLLLIMLAVGIVIWLAVFIYLTCFVYVSEKEIGIVEANFIFFSNVPQNWPYGVVPRWHNGVWAPHLVTGYHFLPFYVIWGKIRFEGAPVIETDKRGYVISLIGQDLPQGTIMAIRDYDFYDAETFLFGADHYRTPCARLLNPGQHNIFAKVIGEREPVPTGDVWPFVIREISATTVKEGEGLTLISNIGAIPSKSEEWAKAILENGDEITIEGLVDFNGSIDDINDLRTGIKRGITKITFGPGKYFFHPEIFRHTTTDTTLKNICFTKNSQEGSNNFPAVKAYTKGPYGFDIEFELGIQVPLKKVPMMVAINANMEGLIHDVVVPQIKDIVLSVAESISLDELIEEQAEKFVKVITKRFDEEIDHFFADFVYFRIVEITYGKEAQNLIDLRTRAIEAEKEKIAIIAEQTVATAKVDLERILANARNQEIVVTAELHEKAAKFIADATNTRGEALQAITEKLKEFPALTQIVTSLQSQPDGISKLLDAISQWFSSQKRIGDK